MARTSQIPLEKLTALLQLRGPVSASELAAALKVTRATVVRSLNGFDRRLVVLGAARSTRYALRRPIRSMGDRWPVYRIDGQGRAESWAVMEALYERRWRMTWVDQPPAWAGHFTDRDGFFEGYPFFLSDIRPQGFLGRIMAGRVSRQLDLPANPQTWSDDQTQIFLLSQGVDLPGSVVMGDDCLRQALEQAVFSENSLLVPEAEAARRYPALAAEIMTAMPGSSAGGEHPKFLTRLQSSSGESRSVLVKFSPPMDQPAGRRWADLLRCEYHAQSMLEAQGLALPGARTLDSGGLRFLEVPRFDRTSAGGRRGVVSLEALHDAAAGSGQGTWPQAVAELRECGLTGDDAVDTARRLHAFGGLIGNTDMHRGNLALWLDDTLPFRVAPAYDMQPMFTAPGPQGGIVDRPFTPPVPLPADHEAWLEASGWAVAFWRAVVDDPEISAPFRAAAVGFLETVERLRRHWA